MESKIMVCNGATTIKTRLDTTVTSIVMLLLCMEPILLSLASITTRIMMIVSTFRCNEPTRGNDSRHLVPTPPTLRRYHLHHLPYQTVLFQTFFCNPKAPGLAVTVSNIDDTTSMIHPPSHCRRKVKVLQKKEVLFLFHRIYSDWPCQLYCTHNLMNYLNDDDTNPCHLVVDHW